MTSNRIIALEQITQSGNGSNHQSVKKESIPFNVKRPSDAVNWLLSEHRKRNLQPQFDYLAYLRGAKKFLDIYGSNAEYLLKMFEDNSCPKHPFTFKFVIEQCAYWDDGERKPKPKNLTLI